MNGARTTPWEGLVHCTGTVLDMEAVEDIDEACWLTITVDLPSQLTILTLKYTYFLPKNRPKNTYFAQIDTY